MSINKLKKIISENKTGFTIIESLFAISILILSLTGPMAFSQSGLRASFVSRDQITAFYLAQDAIEFVKNWRDNNVLDNRSWDNNFSYCSTDYCSIDTFEAEYPYNGSSDGILDCGSDSTGCFNGDPLKIDPNDSHLGHDGEEDSIFHRQIKMKKINTGEIKITVEVKWTTQEVIGERQIEVVEHIFNWNAF